MSTKTKGRRPSGEGSIYRAADGRWRAVVDLGWADGRRQRKYVSGATQAETLAKLRAAQRDADIGVRTDARLSVAEFLDGWVRVSNTSSAEVSVVQHQLRGHVAPASPGGSDYGEPGPRRRARSLDVSSTDPTRAPPPIRPRKPSRATTSPAPT